MEQTLIVLKPDAVQRGLIGDIIKRFERVGLKMIAAKMIKVDHELANKHYPADRTEFIVGMANKTLENYKDLGLDPLKDFGTSDPQQIGLKIREWLVEAITAAPVLAMVWEGPHAVELVRKITGHTLPLKSAPGTIRGDFSFDSSALANLNKRLIKNMLHASGNLEEAKLEIALWFKSSEICVYRRVEESIMQ